MRLRRTRPGSNRSRWDGASDVSLNSRVSSAPPRLVVWDFVHRCFDVNRECFSKLSDHVEVNVRAVSSELCKPTRWIDFTVSRLNHITACHDHQNLEHLVRELRECNLQRLLDFGSRKQISGLRFTECERTRRTDEALDVDTVIRSTFCFRNGVED